MDILFFVAIIAVAAALFFAKRKKPVAPQVVFYGWGARAWNQSFWGE